MENIGLYTRTIANLENKLSRINTGKINCIPSPFRRFKNSGDFIGIEQGKYHLIAANTKIGKTKFASFIYLYNVIMYAYTHPNLIRVRIFYYALEETPMVIMENFMCYLLYVLSNYTIRISPQDLKSIDANKPLDTRILELLKSDEYKNILQFFEDRVVFSTSGNPTGINKDLRNYAEANGKVYTKKQKITDPFTKEVKEIDVFDYYVPNDPDEYVEVIVDTINLITLEQGLDLRQCINKLSGEYFVKLRNNYNYIIVVIQQCTAETESNDNFKLNKLRPTLNSLADSRATARDCNFAWALFSPFRYELKEYLKYDITKFRNNIRFAEVLVNRDGQSNSIMPLFFYGTASYFRELPLPTDTVGIEKVYKMLHTIRGNVEHLFLISSSKYKSTKVKNNIIKSLQRWIKKYLCIHN